MDIRMVEGHVKQEGMFGYGYGDEWTNEQGR